MTDVRLSYVSIFTRDVARLASFYVDVFGLHEVAASRSDRYRELLVGDLKIGFPFVDAYAMLDLADQAEPTGVRAMLTFAVDGITEVDRLTARASAFGGRIAKTPFATGFGQVLSIIIDPEGNALRISTASPEQSQ